MVFRFFRKSIKTIKVYGFAELFKRTFIFFDRKIRPTRYYHFDISKAAGGKKILFITGEPKNATSYYRCDIPKMQLEKFGWDVDIVYESFTNKIDVEKYEIIIFYRTPLTHSNQIILDKAKQEKKLLIYSVDDFVYRRDLLETLDYVAYLDKDDAARLLDRADGMAKLMGQCDYGIASTNYLAENMRKFIKGQVFVSRNGIIKDYAELLGNKPKENLNAKGRKIILGYYSGSETHDRDLNIIWPSLQKILDEFNNVQLNIGGRINFNFGTYSSRVNKLPFVPRNKFMKILAHTDINLLPLENTEFNHGKSEIKFTEAALVQVPTIASAVGDLRSIIEPEIGVLVNDGNDWYASLKNLITDSELRINLGQKSRDFVLKNYNLEILGKQLNDFLIKI